MDPTSIYRLSFDETALGNEYRFYSFTNFYVSSLQKGLQTAHAVSEMSVSKMSDKATAVYNDWAKIDKTIIILNGGNCAGLKDIFNICESFGEKLGLPVVKFHEDEQSLNGALTAVGIILPKNIYDFAADCRASRDYYAAVAYDLCSAELAFIDMLNRCGLAN